MSNKLYNYNKNVQNNIQNNIHNTIACKFKNPIDCSKNLIAC